MLDRRRFLQAAAGFTFAATAVPAHAAPRRLTVVTAYPQEVISRYMPRD